MRWYTIWEDRMLSSGETSFLQYDLAQLIVKGKGEDSLAQQLREELKSRNARLPVNCRMEYNFFLNREILAYDLPERKENDL